MSAQTVATAARLRLADHIGDGDGDAAELAEATGTDPDALVRLLRALAALEILAESAPGRFRLTAAGALLRMDQPDSMHAVIMTYSDPFMLNSWRDLDTAMRTGRPRFDDLSGADFRSSLARHPALSAQFNAAMRQVAQPTARLLPQHYDLSRFRTVADIGGNDGTLLSEVLRAQPHLRGILFDTAEGMAQAEDTLRAAGVAERCETQVGDIFTSVPEGADLYLMKSVIHVWDDDHCVAIMENCRKAIPDEGRLLIIEAVLPDVVDHSVPFVIYLFNLNMLVNVGGRERTRADFEELCTRSGFTLKTVTPLPPFGSSIIEAVPT